MVTTRIWGTDNKKFPRIDSGNTIAPGPVKSDAVAKNSAQLILQACLAILCLPRTPRLLRLLASRSMAINARAEKKK